MSETLKQMDVGQEKCFMNKVSLSLTKTRRHPEQSRQAFLSHSCLLCSIPPNCRQQRHTQDQRRSVTFHIYLYVKGLLHCASLSGVTTQTSTGTVILTCSYYR